MEKKPNLAKEPQPVHRLLTIIPESDPTCTDDTMISLKEKFENNFTEAFDYAVITRVDHEDIARCIEMVADGDVEVTDEESDTLELMLEASTQRGYADYIW